MRARLLLKMDKMLQALETLTEQEEMLIKDGLLNEADKIRQRIAEVTRDLDPLVSSLKEQGGMTDEQRKRAKVITVRRERSHLLLKTAAEKVSSSLSELTGAHRRLGSMRNAYGAKLYAGKRPSHGGKIQGHG